MALARIARSFSPFRQGTTPAMDVWVCKNFSKFLVLEFQAMAMIHWHTRFSMFDSSGKAVLERRFRRSFFWCCFWLCARRFEGAHARNSPRAFSKRRMGIVRVPWVSTLLTRLLPWTLLLVSSLNYDRITGTLQFIYYTSLSGTVEEKNLSTSTAPFPLMHKLSITDPAADFGDPRDAGIDHDRNAIHKRSSRTYRLAKTRFRGNQ
jgi:hypothetical protein